MKLLAHLVTGATCLYGTAVDAGLERLLGVKCPICRDRTKCLRVHINVNHTGVRP